MVYSVPYWLVLEEIKCTVHVALPKWPIKQIKPVQALKAYCIDTVKSRAVDRSTIQFWKLLAKGHST